MACSFALLSSIGIQNGSTFRLKARSTSQIIASAAIKTEPPSKMLRR
jgi:hypothetical protein